jgi:hypothetical protein
MCTAPRVLRNLGTLLTLPHDNLQLPLLKGSLERAKAIPTGEAWAEADLHYAPYRSGQTVLFLDIGIGTHF